MHPKDSILEISIFLFIPLSEIQFKFVRSSGPGGQNVNKVNSKAVLYWNVFANQSLPEEIKTKIIKKCENKINKEGFFILSCDSYRDQSKNKKECLEKLIEILKNVTHVQTKRKKTKPSYSSVMKEKSKKQKHSDKKKNRSNKNFY